jgi:hypothetical protein
MMPKLIPLDSWQSTVGNREIYQPQAALPRILPSLTPLSSHQTISHTIIMGASARQVAKAARLRQEATSNREQTDLSSGGGAILRTTSKILLLLRRTRERSPCRQCWSRDNPFASNQTCSDGMVSCLCSSDHVPAPVLVGRRALQPHHVEWEIPSKNDGDADSHEHLWAGGLGSPEQAAARAHTLQLSLSRDDSRRA